MTNIVGRADLIAALAVLGGLLICIRAIEAAGGRRLAWLAALAAITTLGVFAKESAVVIVGVIGCTAVRITLGKARRPRSTTKIKGRSPNGAREAGRDGARRASRAKALGEPPP